ncbi:MAG TPA: ROK family protein [Oculatellaceae cyanobacterium]
MRYIGIDIGGTKIAGGIVTGAGEILSRFERPTPIKDGGETILRTAISVAQLLLEDKSAAGEQIAGVGIGAGGQIDTVQGLVYSATDVIPGWKGIRIAEAFGTALGLPAAVDNDVNVLALGENRFGAARAFPNGTVVFLALGTGVGGAILTNGCVHHGAHWSGGELGHILLSMDADARKDTGGARGTLEAYCSGPGLVETYLELSGKSGGEITGHDVVKDAKARPDGPGARAIAKTGEYLGFGLVTLANALDPDLFVVGGGLSDLGEDLLVPARKVLSENALPGPATSQVVLAGLGNDAAIVGAACLVMPRG